MSKVEDAYNLRSGFKDFCDYLQSVDVLEFERNILHLNEIERNLQTFFEKQAAIHYENVRNEE